MRINERFGELFDEQFDEWDQRDEETDPGHWLDLPQREQPEVSIESIRKRVHAKLDQDPAERRKQMYSIIKRGLCASIAAASLVTVACATVAYHKRASESLAGLFGTAHSETLDQIGRPVGVSDTVDGVTITVEAVIGDAAYYAMICRITRDDGTPFALPPDGGDTTDPVSSRDSAGGHGDHLPLYFGNDDALLVNFPGVEQSYSYFCDDDPTDNAITYVLIHELRSGEQPPRVARLEWTDLLTFDADGNAVPLASGTWKLSFALDFEDTTITLPAGQTFQRDGMAFTIQQVTLSPIALRVNYTATTTTVAPSDRSANPAPDQTDGGYLESVPLVVRKVDGTRVDLSDAGGKVQQTQTGPAADPATRQAVCQKGGIFREVIPLEEVAAVVVGDVEIPVETATE